MVFCAGVACVANLTANRMAAKVTMKFSMELRKDLFRKTLYLSAADTDRFTVPSLESRLTTDTYNVQNFIGMMQRMGVRAPILLVGGICITLIMDKILAFVMIATLPLIFAVVYGVSRKGVPLYINVQKSIDKMVRVVREDVQGIRVIKALSKNEYENHRYDEVNKNLSKEERRAGIIMGVVNPIMTLLMNLGIVAVVSVVAERGRRGEVERLIFGQPERIVGIDGRGESATVRRGEPLGSAVVASRVESLHRRLRAGHGLTGQTDVGVQSVAVARRCQFQAYGLVVRLAEGCLACKVPCQPRAVGKSEVLVPFRITMVVSPIA